MKIPLIAWIFQGIPESIGLAALVISICVNRLSWDIILKVGVSQAIAAYLIRLLPFTPGVHVVLLIVALSIFSIYLAKLELKKAFIVSTVSMGILILMEVVFVNIITVIGVFTIEDIMNTELIRIMVSLPQVVMLYVLAYVIAKKKIHIDRYIYKDAK